MSGLVAVSGAWFALLIAVATQAPQASLADKSRAVPDVAIQAASEGHEPEEFARAMASLRVPAGMILEDNASRRPALPGLRFSVNAAPGDRSLGFALQTFKRSHPDYVIDESHVPGYILYPRASACVEALEKRVTVRLRGAANVALHQLALAVNASVPHAPPAGVFAGSAHADRAEEELFRQAVEVVLEEASIKEALLAVSRAAPGIVWVVRERPDKNHGRPACMLGLTTGNLEIVTSYRINP